MLTDERQFEDVDPAAMKGRVVAAAKLTEKSGLSTGAGFSEDGMAVSVGTNWAGMGGTRGKLTVTPSGGGCKVCLQWEKIDEKATQASQVLWDKLNYMQATTEDRLFEGVASAAMKGRVIAAAKLTEKSGLTPYSIAPGQEFKFEGDAMGVAVGRVEASTGGTGGKIMVTQFGGGSRVCLQWEKVDEKATGISYLFYERLYKETCPRIEVCLASGEIRSYQTIGELREDILGGALSKSLQARSVETNTEGAKVESRWTPLEAFAVHNEELRPLYRPIWHSTIKYLLYGVFFGIGLKAIDSTIGLFPVNPFAAIGMVFVVIGSVLGFLPMLKWGFIGIGALMIFGSRFGIMGLWLLGVGVAIVGSIFGAPLGMMVGTIVGHFKRRRARTAPDAGTEGKRPYVLGILFPAIALAIFAAAFAWLYSRLPELVR